MLQISKFVTRPALVLSIGGSVVLSEEATTAFLQDLARMLQRVALTHRLFVVVGGGFIARRYIKLGRELGFDEDTLDVVGVDVTRINARIIAFLLGNANTDIPHTVPDALKLSTPVIVMGGTGPRHSTDTVGAELAEATKADRFVNATNVDGIYTKDPNKFPDARKLIEISVDDLIATYGTTWKGAGSNVVIDQPALAIIKRAKIPTVVVNGKRLDQLECALTGKPFDGTTILV